MIRTKALILTFAALLTAGVLLSGCGHTPPQIPTSVPAAVEVTDATLKAASTASLDLLKSLGGLTDEASKIRGSLFADGVGSPQIHKRVSDLLIRVAEMGVRAHEAIVKGVSSWAQVKALLDPLLADINGLIQQVYDVGGAFTGRFHQTMRTIGEVAWALFVAFTQPGVPNAVRP